MDQKVQAWKEWNITTFVTITRIDIFEAGLLVSAHPEFGVAMCDPKQSHKTLQNYG